nr:hypothetical protein 18 [Balneolaceae bacterium]
MNSSRLAIINHLQSAEGSTGFDDTKAAETIKEFAGEIDEKEMSIRIRIDLPAILILFMDGYPLRDAEEAEFVLLFATKNDTNTREESELDALEMVEEYSHWLNENQNWQHGGKHWSLINVDQARSSSFSVDHKYAIYQVTVEMRRIG